MENIKKELKSVLQELIGDEVILSEDLGFFDMGVSSLTITTFCERIKEIFDVSCDETDIFNYANIEELADYINSQR